MKLRFSTFEIITVLNFRTTAFIISIPTQQDGPAGLSFWKFRFPFKRRKAFHSGRGACRLTFQASIEMHRPDYLSDIFRCLSPNARRKFGDHIRRHERGCITRPLRNGPRA